MNVENPDLVTPHRFPQFKLPQFAKTSQDLAFLVCEIPGVHH